jgi:hypothetical protein
VVAGAVGVDQVVSPEVVEAAVGGEARLAAEEGLEVVAKVEAGLEVDGVAQEDFHEEVVVVAREDFHEVVVVALEDFHEAVVVASEAGAEGAVRNGDPCHFFRAWLPPYLQITVALGLDLDSTMAFLDVKGTLFSLFMFSFTGQLAE